MVPPLEDTTLSFLLYLRSPKKDAGVFAGRALRCVPSTWINGSQASQARESACGESTLRVANGTASMAHHRTITDMRRAHSLSSQRHCIVKIWRD